MATAVPATWGASAPVHRYTSCRYVPTSRTLKMQKGIELLYIVASPVERNGVVGRLVANLLGADGAPEWSAEATVRRNEETGHFALDPVVPAADIPGTVILELRSAIERAWHYGGNIKVRGGGRPMLPNEAVLRIGAPSDARPILRAVWPWQEPDEPRDIST